MMDLSRIFGEVREKFSIRFLKNYLSLGMFAAIVLLTAGFQISCPPPETLENIDTDFNPAFHDGVSNGDYYAPTKINAIAVDQRTGSFFVGGSFYSIDNVPAVNIAFYDKTGDRFYQLFGKGLTFTSIFGGSSVNALAISGEYLYIGGRFSQTADASPTTNLNNIARYYIGNGSLEAVQQGFFSAVSNNGLNDEVNALEVFDNDLYVGGRFTNTSAGSVSGLNRIARYAMNCGSNCWSAVHSGFNSGVFALEKGKNGTDDVLYIGGEFTQLVGSMSAVNRFTAYRPSDNAMITSLSGFNGRVKALAYSNSDSRIYAGGSFTANADNSLTLNRIAYNSGGSWTAFAAGGFNGDVNALAVREYLLFVGGDFTQLSNGIAHNRITYIDALHPFGENWFTVPFSGVDGSVNAMGIDEGDEINNWIVGGDFTQTGDGTTNTNLKRVTKYDVFIGNQSRNSAAGTDPITGLSPLGLLNGRALNNPVAALAADANGNVYAGGSFTGTANGATTLNRIAHYNPATKTWSPFANGGLNGNVQALTIVGDNLYVGGYFTATADGAVTNLNRIARYNLTTNTWSSLGNNGLNFAVLSFAVLGNNLYVGGSFTRTADNAVTNLNRVAVYDLMTNTWSPLANDGMNGDVNSLAIVGDEVYLGGDFTRTFDDSYFLFRFTRYNLTSQTWFEVANSGLNSTAQRLWVVGNFVYVNGSFTRTRDNTIILDQLARYDIAANSWSMMTGDDGSRNAAILTNAMVQVGNDLYVGGNFNGTGNSIARYFTQIYLQQWKTSAPTSDWFDNANWKTGTAPTANVNAVIPSGAGQINIASADVSLNDFNFNGGTLTIGAGRTLTINGILSLNGGTINGDGTLVIANCQPDGIMGGSPSAYIQTALMRCVNGSGTFNFPVGTISGYSPITVKGITGTGNISVKANQGAYTNPAGGLPANRIARWWQIENPGGGVTNSNLYLNYRETDIAGPESNYRAYRISGGTAQMVNSSVNTFSNVATAENVSSFSDWTLAELAPTAAEVSLGGRVLTSNRQGISRTLVTLIKQNGETRSVLTNSFGNYRFHELPVGEIFVISVYHRKYQFNPASYVVTLKDNATDINFVGETNPN